MTPPQLATLGEVVAFLVGLGVIVAGLITLWVVLFSLWFLGSAALAFKFERVLPAALSAPVPRALPPPP